MWAPGAMTRSQSALDLAGRGEARKVGLAARGYGSSSAQPPAGAPNLSMNRSASCASTATQDIGRRSSRPVVTLRW